MDVEYGYEPERFQNLITEQFVCPICTLVARKPRECIECGAMFCEKCMLDWLKRKNECPRSRCNLQKNPAKEISGALGKIYNNLDIKCKYFDKCKRVVKLVELEYHEDKCQQEKCQNFDACEEVVKKQFIQDKVCSRECKLLAEIKSANGNWKIALDHIKKFAKDIDVINNQPAITDPFKYNIGDQGVTNFKWDRYSMGQGIEVSPNGKDVFLKEQQYMFRSIISDTALNGGVHYWEIHADQRTENELKIGIACEKQFNYNSAFCDYQFGFAYYGLGQLRSGSNAAGTQYGKRFKKNGILGVYLDMNKGNLHFALDGEYWGIAFTNALLKRSPVYAAVSLLHCAGCKLVTGKPIPQYFINK